MKNVDRRDADYVIVGGGTAGCVVAARLSEDPERQVVLLEAGPEYGPAQMADPTAWPTLLGSDVDWAFTTAPQSGMGGAELGYPRGRVLGGSSSINAMAHIRAHRSSYDLWAEKGATGWSFDELFPYFRRSESASGRDDSYRGSNGPMVVSVPGKKSLFEESLLGAAIDLGHPFVDDLNNPTAEGIGWVEMNIREGRRQSAADAYLRPVLQQRPNLTIITEATVHRLIVEGGRCRGAEYLSNRRIQQAWAGREVVLCAGAIGSPHILLLSGIGPATDLRSHEIDVLVDLPGVGQNLHDHPGACLVRSADKPVCVQKELHGSLFAMLRTDSGLTAPDVQLIFWDFPDWQASERGLTHGYTIVSVALQPLSRGQITLTSSDPTKAPRIDPGLLTIETDFAAIIRGLQIARDIAAVSGLSDHSNAEYLPGPDVRETAALRAYIRAAARSALHPVGTCRIGDDTQAVVDSELRVYGIDGLRVADASVMPSIVAANTNATVLALAERAAHRISMDPSCH